MVGSLLPAGFADQRQLVAPMSGLSIALVISVGSLYKDTGLAWVVTAVIGGSIVSEFLVQLTSGADVSGPAPIDELDSSAPIDELDDRDSGAVEGPIYRDEHSEPHSAKERKP